ncbi:methyltransferase family protein, partial [Pseudomonas sp. SIMBA_068]|uniref:methyltransferase family protein n=1 Tax=Pseudomonas sp. SIMBA_068 TaxID=3085808 RepID=UPI00397CAEEE
PTTLMATTGPYRWTRNPMYLGMALVYAGIAVGFDGAIALALLPLVLIVIQKQVIAREERYLESKFGDDYRRYKAEVRR